MSRLRELEEENSRLKKMYADVQLQKDILQEALTKKVVTPSQRREMARQTVQARTVSIRKARDIFGISEHCYRYQPKLAEGDALILEELLRLTQLHKSWGFGSCYPYLRNCAGYSWNHKRVYRIYRELELNLRIRLNRRLHRDTPETLRVQRLLIKSGRWTSCTIPYLVVILPAIERYR